MSLPWCFFLTRFVPIIDEVEDRAVAYSRLKTISFDRATFPELLSIYSDNGSKHRALFRKLGSRSIGLLLRQLNPSNVSYLPESPPSKHSPPEVCGERCNVPGGCIASTQANSPSYSVHPTSSPHAFRSVSGMNFEFLLRLAHSRSWAERMY